MNFRFCRGGMPPRTPDQSRNCTKITPEMERSRGVRIQNTKFYYFSTSMKKVMIRSLKTKKKFFFGRKRIFFGTGMVLPFKALFTRKCIKNPNILALSHRFFSNGVQKSDSGGKKVSSTFLWFYLAKEPEKIG